MTPIHDPQETQVMPSAEYRPAEAHADEFVTPAGPADDDERQMLQRLQRSRRWRGT